MGRSRLSVIAVVGVLLFAACSGSSGGDDDPDSIVDDDAELAPEVMFEFFDGSVRALSEFQGRPVVLNFWASWCPACIAEMPDFELVHQRFADEVVFLGVDVQDVDRVTAERFVAETGVTYPIADDPTGSVFAAFGGFAMPTTIFIDARGVIVARQDGAIFEEQLAEEIITLFGVRA